MAKKDQLRTAKEYLLNPNKDPIQAASALYGRYRNDQYISKVDAAARGAFSLATSVIRGTFNFTQQTARDLNATYRVTERIRNVTTTLLGTETANNFFDNIDFAKKDLVDGLRQAGREISLLTTGKSTSNLKEILTSGASRTIRAMKTAILSTAGVRFDLTSYIENFGTVIDIETGGLFKDAPILQIGMSKMSSAKKFSELSDELKSEHLSKLAALTPEEQIAKHGMLDINLVPMAILRDTAARPDGRKPTYKMFEYMPRSVEEFEDKFSKWAVKDKSKFKVKEFYEALADESYVSDKTGKSATRISDSKMQEILGTLKKQGYIDVTGAGRFYSQREGAKWSMIFSLLTGKENGALIAANLNFESFRVGKLWNYYIKDMVGDVKNTTSGVPVRSEPVNLQGLPDEVHYLNEDPDVLKAMDKTGEEAGAITGHREVRSKLMSTWRSKFKLNILDENNYYYRDKVNKLQRQGRGNELISLFPEWGRRVGKGLKTADQLELTKMIFSGLMFTGYSPIENDIYSGAKIDNATRVLFNEAEHHLALFDVLHQSGILAEGKAIDLTSDLYNIYHAKESNSLRGQIKSFFSAMSILTDSKKKAWFDLDTIFRQTEIAVEDSVMSKYLGRNITYFGTAGEISKEFEIDKELMRISETVDAVTGKTKIVGGQAVPSSIFADTSPKDLVNIDVPTEDGGVEKVGVRTSGKEPFSLGDVRGTTRHEMLTGEGDSLFVRYKAHDYNLHERIQSKFNQFLEEASFDNWDGDQDVASIARQRTKEWLVKQYSKTQGVAGTGRTGEDLVDRFNQVVAPMGEMVQDEATGRTVLQEELTQRMEGTRRIVDQVREHPTIAAGIQRAARAAGEPTKVSGRFFSDAYTKAKDLMTGREKISDIEIGSIVGLPSSFIEKTFNVNSRMADFAVRAGGRIAGVALLGAATVGAVGAGYAIDEPSWKKTTGEILRMTGQEKEILPEGHYEKAGKLQDVATPYYSQMDQANPAGAALQGIDSGKVDYAVGDGDTIQILSKGFFGLGRKSLGSVRIAGMDTPEVAHGGGGGGPGDMPFSAPGKQYLSNVLSARQGSQVVIGPGETYGRGVGLVTDQAGTNYSYQMVQQGLGSVLFRERPEDDLVNQSAYMMAEGTARKENKGMWAQPFYYGAQSGIAPRDRVGWNKMTPYNMSKFNFDRSPGSTAEQALKAVQEMQPTADFNSINSLVDPFFTQAPKSSGAAYQQKQQMASMQQNALIGSMQRNRGRARNRR